MTFTYSAESLRWIAWMMLMCSWDFEIWEWERGELERKEMKIFIHELCWFFTVGNSNFPHFIHMFSSFTSDSGIFLRIIRQPNARIISIKNHKIKWNSSCLCSIFESFSVMVGVRKKFQRHQIKRQRRERITSSVMEFKISSALRLCKSIQYSAEFLCSTTGVWKRRRNYKNLQFKMSRKRKMFFTKKSGEGEESERRKLKI